MSIDAVTNYISKHTGEVTAALLIFGSLLTTMIFTNGFDVSSGAFKEGFFENLSASGVLTQVAITVAVSSFAAIIIHKVKKLNEVFEHTKALSIALKILAVIAITIYLLPNPAFGGNMLIGVLLIGNIVAFSIIYLAKKIYSTYILGTLHAEAVFPRIHKKTQESAV